MKKKVLVSADRNETRVAMLEAPGTPGKRSAGKAAVKDNTKWRTALPRLPGEGDSPSHDSVYRLKLTNTRVFLALRRGNRGGPAS